MFADKANIGICQVADRFNAHSVKFFTDTASDTPDFINRERSHQLTLALNIREIHHPASLFLPLFGRMVSQLGQGFGLGDTDPNLEACFL